MYECLKEFLFLEVYVCLFVWFLVFWLFERSFFVLYVFSVLAFYIRILVYGLVPY
jgi:hypothetical protein